MKRPRLLAENATDEEVVKALSELPSPGPRKIALALDLEEIHNKKYLNVHEIMEDANKEDIIDAYNTLQWVKAGRMKVFRNIFKFGVKAFQEILPIVEKLLQNKGKINLKEIAEFVDFKASTNKTKDKINS